MSRFSGILDREQVFGWLYEAVYPDLIRLFKGVGTPTRLKT